MFTCISIYYVSSVIVCFIARRSINLLIKSSLAKLPLYLPHWLLWYHNLHLFFTFSYLVQLCDYLALCRKDLLLPPKMFVMLAHGALLPRTPYVMCHSRDFRKPYMHV